jgi:RNA polymerase sigma factor (sigma-70 family)
MKKPRRTRQAPRRTEAAVETLVTDNMPLAHFMAGKTFGLDYDEAFSAAMEGLQQAAEAWDEGRGIPFGSYAPVVMRHRIWAKLTKGEAIKRGRGCVVISLDALMPGTEDAEIGDVIPDVSMPPAYAARCEEELQWALLTALARLPEREREVIERWFGLDDRTPCVLEDMGKEWGVSRQRVEQIKASGLKKLRKWLGKDF